MRLAATLSPNTCLVSLVKGPMDKLDVDVVYENLRVGPEGILRYLLASARDNDRISSQDEA